MSKWSTRYTRDEFRLMVADAVGEGEDIVEYFQSRLEREGWSR